MRNLVAANPATMLRMITQPLSIATAAVLARDPSETKRGDLGITPSSHVFQQALGTTAQRGYPFCPASS